MSEAAIIPDDLTAKSDMAKDQWGNVIRVQIHFNELISRTRQLTATVVLATYGSAVAFFSAHPHTMWNIGTKCIKMVHVSTPVVILGMLFLAVGFFTDRLYYFRLLIAAVEVGESIEKTKDLPVKLSVHLSRAVNRRHAAFTVWLFYGVATLVGLALIWFVNRAAIVGIDPSSRWGEWS